MKTRTFFLTLALLGVWVIPALANTDQLKLYRKVYPDLKPSCLYCHIDKAPKKDDGKHDTNAYGLKLKELMGEGELTEDIIKSVGRHDEFKAEETASGEAQEEATTTEGTTDSSE